MTKAEEACRLKELLIRIFNLFEAYITKPKYFNEKSTLKFIKKMRNNIERNLI
jgi:hypothetical protein